MTMFIARTRESDHVTVRAGADRAAAGMQTPGIAERGVLHRVKFPGERSRDSRRVARATRPPIGTGILAGRGFRQPADIMRPTFGMAIAFRRTGKATMRHAQQRAAILFE